MIGKTIGRHLCLYAANNLSKSKHLIIDQSVFYRGVLNNIGMGLTLAIDECQLITIGSESVVF